MKILFICHANVCRSQMAEGIFNNISDIKSISAGTDPGEWKGRKIGLTNFIATSMKEKGINIDNNVSKKINKKMFEDADKVIVMVDKNNLPNYMKNSKKLIFWKVEDPCDSDINLVRKVRDEIKNKVEQLIKELK